MKRFETLLEREETEAHKKARELGLKYRGFGYWQDPRTGKTTYKTENDELVPISGNEQQEMDDEDPMSLGMTDPNGEEDPNNPAIAAGTNVGPAPEPGEERPDPDENPDELGWEPGPDGDTMVNDQEKNEGDEIQPDVYVGRNNNAKWTAGPDGSNYKNMSFDKMMETIMLEAIQPRSKSYTGAETRIQNALDNTGNTIERGAAGALQRMGTETKLSLDSFLKEAVPGQPTDMGNPSGTGAISPAERARQLGLESDGHGSYLDPATGEIRARTVNDELVFYDQSRASGGAVSDGSGGAELTQSAPSWVDPDTGLIIVPPAKPESPEEVAAIPDPTPATEPQGFASFMQKKKVERTEGRKKIARDLVTPQSTIEKRILKKK